MIVTTTDTIPRKKIVKILGIVFASSGSMAKPTIEEAREDACEKLKKEAEKLGANAIVGVKAEHVVTLACAITLTGTAVEIK